MRGLALPEDVICYIAAKIDNNTRELEGAVIKIQGMAMLKQGVIDMELAKAALGESIAADQRRVTIQNILDAVTKYYNVKLSDLQSKKRHKSIAFPRRSACFWPAVTPATASRKSAATSAAAITPPSSTPSAPSPRISRTTRKWPSNSPDWKRS